MKRLIFLFLFGTFLIVCKAEEEDKNYAFDQFKEQFIENLWKMYPDWASGVGYHKYDSILTIPDKASRMNEIRFCQVYLDSLISFQLEQLSDNNKTDYYVIQNFLNSVIWSIKYFKKHEWNPAYYNVGESFAQLITEPFDKLENRLRNISIKIEKVAPYYEAARQNIKSPTIEHIDLAILQNKGVISVFEEMLRDSVDISVLTEEEKKQLINKSKQAVDAISNYINWLSTEIKPALTQKTARSFRIGKTLYDKKFKYDIQSFYSSEQIYEKALKRKSELHQEMLKISKQLWPQYFGDNPMLENDLLTIKKVIDTLSVNHVHRDSFSYSIEKHIPQLINFINAKNLIYLDPDKPLVVRKTPGYMEGVAGASILSPGPYDVNANTYYNVSPLTHYTKERAESYLREYNYYILQILNIHEAIPGHYTQLIYSNQSPSIIKSILGNGAMIEGWAVYAERMMLEEGYGNHDPAMWLMYYKWHLRIVCNTILDYSVHTLNMQEHDAMHLLVNEAFQQEAEARGKWRRVNLTQVQLCSYFTGFSEIYDFREELKKKLGDKFDLKTFHEKFLSYGSAPVKYIRELMLKEMEANGGNLIENKKIR